MWTDIGTLEQSIHVYGSEGKQVNNIIYECVDRYRHRNTMDKVSYKATRDEGVGRCG